MIQKELEVISTFYHFGTIFGIKKKNNKKIAQAGGVGNQHLPLALSTLLQQNLQIFGTKPLPRRRFLQHYYRGTFIESHQKPIEAPQISLFCSILALIPQSGDFSGAALGVRSVALLQVA